MAHKQLIIRNGESSLVTRRFIGAVKQCSVANTQTLSFQTLQNVTGGTRSCNKRSLNIINRVEGSTCILLTRINFTTLRWLTSIRFVLNNREGGGRWLGCKLNFTHALRMRTHAALVTSRHRLNVQAETVATRSRHIPIVVSLQYVT